MTDINVTVSDQIIQVLDALCEKFGVAVEWGQNNIVPYVQVLLEKWVRYNIISQIITLAFFAVILFVGCKGTKWLCNNWKTASKENDYDREVAYKILSISAIIVMAIGIILFAIEVVSRINSIIQCTVFPELWIIQSVQALMS